MSDGNGNGIYRTGQAARLLNVSNHHIRRLCEARLVSASMVDGRWQIPASAVQKLKKEGIPPIPQVERGGEQEEGGCGRPPQPPAVPWEEPEVREEAARVAIAARRLQRRKLEL